MSKLNASQIKILSEVPSKEARKKLKQMFKIENAKKDMKDSKKRLKKLFKHEINPTKNEKH